MSKILKKLCGRRIKSYFYEEGKQLTIYFEEGKPFQVWFIGDILFNSGENVLREKENKVTYHTHLKAIFS